MNICWFCKKSDKFAFERGSGSEKMEERAVFLRVFLILYQKFFKKSSKIFKKRFFSLLYQKFSKKSSKNGKKIKNFS